ncbi:DUF5677 domain-containing protein [Pseudomonas viridiflava]|uniref:DUF5677 domain-containing protein n=1 Tax=Pseudomonas viridiflava TaxID=33069 RepID=UPI0021599B42|nr:DUF5677 domain-containing protein [Pseudomonas viridiflava]
MENHDGREDLEFRMTHSMPYQRDAEIETEFGALITLMADMITSQANAPLGVAAPPEWSINLHILSMKLFKHLCSARTLLEPCSFGTATLPPYGYIDHSSIAAVTRSSIENYLVMHWLLGGGDDSVREFNHLIWMHSGWKKRSKLVATTEEAKVGRQRAEDAAAELWRLVQASPHYQKYNKDQQKRLRKGSWDVDWHWHDLACQAGLHNTYFTSIYPYLSGYTHSDFISCLQIGQASTIGTQYMLGASSISISLMVLGHFSTFYANLYPAAKAVLDASETKHLVSKWYLRAEDMDFLYSK